jgi:hypothetical protein
MTPKMSIARLHCSSPVFQSTKNKKVATNATAHRPGTSIEQIVAEEIIQAREKGEEPTNATGKTAGQILAENAKARAEDRERRILAKAEARTEREKQKAITKKAKKERKNEKAALEKELNAETNAAVQTPSTTTSLPKKVSTSADPANVSSTKVEAKQKSSTEKTSPPTPGSTNPDPAMTNTPPSNGNVSSGATPPSTPNKPPQSEAKPTSATPSSPKPEDINPQLTTEQYQAFRGKQSVGPFTWKAAGLFLLTGTGLIIYFRHEKDRMDRLRMPSQNTN